MFMEHSIGLKKLYILFQNPVPADACWGSVKVYCTDENGNCNLGLNFLWEGTPCDNDKVSFETL